MKTKKKVIIIVAICLAVLVIGFLLFGFMGKLRERPMSPPPRPAASIVLDCQGV